LLFTLLQYPNSITLWYLVAAFAGGSGVGIAEYVSSQIKRSRYAPDVNPVAQQFGRSMHYLGLYILSNVLTLLLAYVLLLIFPGLRPWHWLFGTGAMIQLVGGLALLERIREQVMRGLASNTEGR
jgi:MFS family permease